MTLLYLVSVSRSEGPIIAAAPLGPVVGVPLVINSSPKHFAGPTWGYISAPKSAVLHTKLKTMGNFQP